MATIDARSEFERHLAVALEHLYDPAVLRDSPLMHVLALNSHPDAMLSLQRRLEDAIASLKPANSVPTQSGSWRTHRVLSYRYAEQLTQQEVASDLGLSVRQLRRVEKTAIKVLADTMWVRYHLSQKPNLFGSPAPEQPVVLPESVVTPSREQELDWLDKTVHSERVSTFELVSSVLHTAAPLLSSSCLTVSNAVPSDAPLILVKPAVMRQALLDILALAARCVPGGTMRLSTDCDTLNASLLLHVELKGQTGMASSYAEDLSLVRRLLAISGAQLRVVSDSKASEAHQMDIAAPIAEQLPVLVIEDNQDTIRLLHRYLTNSRFRFVGVPDPREALQMGRGIRPAAIVLDVMMPGLDGWETLAHLRESPITCDVPVIVCTILPQENMALALGAAGFLRKPISRVDLLQALDHLVPPAVIAND